MGSVVNQDASLVVGVAYLLYSMVGRIPTAPFFVFWLIEFSCVLGIPSIKLYGTVVRYTCKTVFVERDRMWYGSCSSL